MLSLFERTAAELAKKIPEDVIEPLKNKIVEVAQLDLSGQAKMKIVKDFAISLLGSEFITIGNSALDTFLQVLYQDLKNSKIID
jgi:hypothetical protein